MRFLASVICATALSFIGCGSDTNNPSSPDASNPDPEPAENWARDVLSTDLLFDVGAQTATATITLAGDSSRTASLDVGDLTLRTVRVGTTDLETSRTDNRLDMLLPDDENPVAITVEYAFQTQAEFRGYSTRGATLTWPYFCGNLFPCKADPADGTTFAMSVTGIPEGETAVYPETIPADAPAYMAAFAVGDYTYLDLGKTNAGTQVGAYYLSGGRYTAISGTRYLADYVDFFEQTYGPYTFGPEVAAVAANWGPGAFGGMEHHPFFHVAKGAMNVREFHAHEAAHGWYGNGVRIACWEDFVLSEGVTEYLGVRAIEHAEGSEAADVVWADLEAQLIDAVETEDTEAYPDGCNEIDILNHPLWSRIPYEKGAFFFRAVEQRIGRAELDASLAKFYQNNVGQARHMSDLIDAIEADTGAELDDLVTGWLKSLGIPAH